MTTRELEEVPAEDEEFSEPRHRIKSGTWRDGQLKKYISKASELCVIGKLILRGTRIVIPSKLRPRVLPLAHEGHPLLLVSRRGCDQKYGGPGLTKAQKDFATRVLDAS